MSEETAGCSKTMTAYASKRAVFSGYEITVSLRSVNSKYLDVNIFFYPDSLSVNLEQYIRDALLKSIQRGRVEVKISASPISKALGLKQDKEFRQFVRQMLLLKRSAGLNGDLALNEVINLYYSRGSSLLPKVSLDPVKVKRVFDRTLKDYETFRHKQARVILSDIRWQLQSIKTEVEKLPGLLKKHSRRLNTDAAKDVNEEIVLLLFYIEEVLRLLRRRPQRIGKLLDFFSQEMLRESNTILAKIRDRRGCALTVYIKEAIERIREHSQNLE